METIQLPRGGWAQVRPGAEIPERYMRQVRALLGPVMPTVLEIWRAGERAKTASTPEERGLAEADMARHMAVLGDDGTRRIEDANDAAICGIVIGWSLDVPCPPTAEVLLDLPQDTYMALRKAAAARSLDAMLDTSMHLDDLADGREPDRSLPFGSSSGSVTPSAAPRSPTGSPSRGSSGAPTAPTSGSAGPTPS